MSSENRLSRIRRTLARRHPSAFLLASQVILLLLYAIFEDSHRQRALISAFSVIVLMMVVWVVNRSSSIKWVVWILAIPAFFLTLLSALNYQNPALLGWSSLLEGLLYFYAAGTLIGYMMADYRVTSDEYFAAGATFTLLAWGFAYAFMVCQAWVPESFINGGHPGAPLTFIEMLFLSFTNLSATGLGDILPISAPSRVLAMLEQFCGVGYVTLVVSRLIGMSLEKREHKRATLHPGPTSNH